METYTNRKKTNRIKIIELAKENRIDIKWIMKSNFESILNKNIDLYRLYFSPEDELGFLKNSLTVGERTFLDSDWFVNLRINDRILPEIQEEICSASLSVITGPAGTGKSEILKKIYLEYERGFISNITSNSIDIDVTVPIFIRLRDCSNGNLEDLIRNRLRDYNISSGSDKPSFAYFFDGIDEVNSSDFSVISACLLRLKNDDCSKSIILSSRNNTTNLTTIIREFKIKEFSIDTLSKKDIGEYFTIRHNKDKTDKFINIESKNVNILNDITDILSIALLWENIEKIDNTTTKIDLISLSVNALIERSRKVSMLNLPEPKSTSIDVILSVVAKEMQISKHINISRFNMQKIVSSYYPKLSYTEIDVIIDYICEIFFEASPALINQQTYSYRHKRYFEFYLYYAVKNVFYEEPAILRELHLLSNKDFMLNIFLLQELKESIEIKDMHKVLVLRFLEDYLGEAYKGSKTSQYFLQKSNFYVGAESYLDSLQLREYLCTKELSDLHTFLKNDPLSISSFLNTGNYWSFVKRYHEIRKVDIRPCIDEILSTIDPYNKAISFENCGAYNYCRCVIDEVSIDEVYDEIIKIKHGCDNNILEMDFFIMAIELYPEWTFSKINIFSVEELEIICSVFLKPHAVKFLFSKNETLLKLREEICKRIASNINETYEINTIVLYNMITNQFIEKERIEGIIEVSNVNHYGTWERELDLHCYAAILLKDSFQAANTDFLLGISIRRILIENYEQNESSILEMILQEIKKYNLIYENWFVYKNSEFLGELIATLKFKTTDIKLFVSELRKYQSVISLFTILYKVMQKNSDLFKVISNQRLITSAYDYANSSISYYDHSSDVGFMYATMISFFDLVKGDIQFETALNNSIFRPSFRKEDIIDYYLPKCLLIAHNNDWYSTSELQNKIERVYEMIKISQGTLDSGSYFDYIKFLLEQCFLDSQILAEMHGYESKDPCESNSGISGSANTELGILTKAKLSKYYNCSNIDVDYSSMVVWKNLIEFEYKHDPKLTKLYKALSKNCFPAESISKINNYFHIITVILTEKAETRNDAIQYVMNRGGRLGLINMIRSFSLTGNCTCARQYLDSLLNLCEALVYPNLERIIMNREKLNRTTKIIDVVCDSSRDQWNIEGMNKRMIFKVDPKVSITWKEEDSDEPYKIKYSLYYESNLVMTFDLERVKESRVMIPLANNETQRIRRTDYQLGLLLTDDKEEYNEYIAQTGNWVD